MFDSSTPDQYLRLMLPRDVIDLPIVDSLDINGWDIIKACRLLSKSNPPLLEWLGSSIPYHEERFVTDRFRSLAHKHCSLRACCEHYFSMARSNFASHIEGKEDVVRKKYLTLPSLSVPFDILSERSATRLSRVRSNQACVFAISIQGQIGPVPSSRQ